MDKLFGLMGKGIQKSLSPTLFKAAYNGKYAYDILDGDDFGVLFEKFRKELKAANVTAPYKEQAFMRADEVSDTAQLCQAANILINNASGKVYADNSDFEGVSLTLMNAFDFYEEDFDSEDEDAAYSFMAGKSALVTGCGGAGRAAVAALTAMGIGDITVLNRDSSKAEKFCSHLETAFDEDLPIRTGSLEEFPEAFREADIIIHTLPGSVALPASPIFSGKRQYILEADYTSARLEAACSGDKNGKCIYLSGHNWLIHQAEIGYLEMTREEPETEAMRKALNFL